MVNFHVNIDVAPIQFQHQFIHEPMQKPNNYQFTLVIEITCLSKFVMTYQHKQVVLNVTLPPEIRSNQITIPIC